MAAKFKTGDVAGGFVIESHITSGNYAISYRARDARYTAVFLKQYKKPSSTSGWLDGFVSYQTELHRRIESDPVLGAFCVRMLDIFPTHRGLCQVFQFVEGGFDLKSCIERKREFDWEVRVLFAKVMLAALDKLHCAQIVHSDLKPENLMILPDPSIKIGYKLRLIDMDFSILTDKKAPWLDSEGFVCTPRYGSPEHARGEVPQTGSDVFTCGLMLGELLGDGHPLRMIEESEVDDATAKCERIAAVTFEREIVGGLGKGEIEEMLARCFAVNADDRPSCGDLLNALNGKGSTASAGGKSAKPMSPAAPMAGGLALHDDNGNHILVRISTELGRRNFANWGEDSKFLSSPQFRLIAGRPGHWRIAHCPSATNSTLLDGVSLSQSAELREGMVVTVGNPDKGIEKFPLHVRLS